MLSTRVLSASTRVTKQLRSLDFSGTQALGCRSELVHHAFRALPQPEMYLKSSGAATILPAGCGPATERRRKRSWPRRLLSLGIGMFAACMAIPLDVVRWPFPISPVAQTVFQSVARCRNTSLFDASFGPRHSRNDPWFCLSRA